MQKRDYLKQEVTTMGKAIARKKSKVPEGMFAIHGFARVQLKEDGEVVSDSGWIGPNMIVNAGIQCLMNMIGKTTGSFAGIGAMAIATGAAPASSDTSLANEYGGTAKRVAPYSAVTSQRGDSTGTATLEFQGSWVSTKCTTASTIDAIGLFDVSNAQGTMLCGTTFTASKWDTNQDLYASYQLRLSFA